MKKRHIILSIGRSCFTRCLGCYNHFSSNTALVSPSHLKPLIESARKIGVEQLTVGGGDPLSHPQIIEILKLIKTNGYKVNMDTVGLPLVENAKIIFNGYGVVGKISLSSIDGYVDYLGIPLDGPTNKINNQFRSGIEDYLSSFKKILSLLNKSSIPISINTVVNKTNYRHLQDIYHILKPYQCIKRWQLFQFMPIGPLGYRNREKFQILEKTFITCVDRLKDIVQNSIIIDSKSCTQRKNLYLLVDSFGIAWTPKHSNVSQWSQDLDSLDEQIIIGDIKKGKKEIDRILKLLFAPV